MHRLLSLVLLLAVLLPRQGHALRVRKRGLLQFSSEEQAALDNLSTVFAGGSSSSSYSSSSSSSSPPPPTPPPQQEAAPPPPSPSYSSSSPPAPSTATTGARFTPAPAVFDRLNLPTYSKISQTSGPVSPDTLNAAAPGSCKSIKDILSSIPQVSEWLALLNSAGYESVLLTDKNAQVTLFVPVNSAFSAGIDAQPLREEKTLQELISNAPDVRNPLAGYSVLRGLWPSSTLTPGTSLPTANTIDKVNPLNIKVVGPTQLQGIGDDAIILQSDIAACGPSVIHIVDQILLPFKFDQGPTDAITGTQVPTPPAAAAAG